ncbi:hypothetical protein CAOG_008536 [Capsaspora owczarzaki ATCC 30864]|uniref:Signal peptidase complex subunit 1 n=2 Tax=Capsaspora owczarzaki (strain ATCC 30864) TaxID=595528 RepID=A0A0D2WJP8_CAPO3|nr:hypothetical protein CAOG_008536 [Capsaspora owczarzaki ATCC 30864]
MTSLFKRVVDTVPSIDYHGQKLAEDLFTWILSGSAVIAFAVGWMLQDFMMTLYLSAAAAAFCVLLVVPPWPFYRRHPVTFLPPLKGGDHGAAEGLATTTPLASSAPSSQPAEGAKHK